MKMAEIVEINHNKKIDGYQIGKIPSEGRCILTDTDMGS
jgi:hypothetical protein